jgi:hypothetical protein
VSVINGGYPDVGVTAERLVYLMENVVIGIMAFPIKGLSLSFTTLFCHEERYVLYVLITELRNASCGSFQSSGLGRKPTCELCRNACFISSTEQ